MSSANVQGVNLWRFALLTFTLFVYGCNTLQSAPPSATSPPVPTKTPTAVPSTATPTLAPTATPTSTPDHAATQSAQATQAAENEIAAINDILQNYGYSSDQGNLGWTQESAIKVRASGGSRVTYDLIAADHEFSNYVLHTNVSWESEVGAAGCGIIFHSERNLEQGQQYRLYSLRLSGLPAWDVELWEFGNWQATVTGDIKYTSAIDQADGATNEYVLIVEDSTLTVYINETRVGTVTIATRSSGVLGAFVWQASGQTTCTFDDTWLWDLDEG